MTTLEIRWDHSAAAPQPVWFPAPAGFAPASIVLTSESGPSTPAQRAADGRLVALLTPTAGIQRYTLAEAPATGGVTAERGDGDQLSLCDGNELVTTYHYGREVPRPFLYPVLGPDGAAVTRHYPMRDDVSGEQRDHRHHRSLYTAYGEVNEVDNWSEEKNHGFVRHLEMEQVTSGPVFGGFVARNRWVDANEEPVMEERRAVTLYRCGRDRRLLDYDVTLTATNGDVHFGDTKEGGLISVRVATTMDAARGGTIENADGGHGEKQCWGRASAWCDYTGPVEGKQVGIAVMDHPDNLRHPSRWHVRDYGLMTANPFGTSTFENDKLKRGEYVLRTGEQLHFRYRVLIHRGNASEGSVAETWNAFAHAATAQAVGP